MHLLENLTLSSKMKRLSDLINKELTLIYKTKKIDIEPCLMPVLLVINSFEKVTVTFIAKELKISQPAVTQFCSTLQKKELIFLKPSSLDKRKKNVLLTRKGTNLVKRLLPIWEEISSQIKEIESSSENALNEVINYFEEKFYKEEFHAKVLNSLKVMEQELELQD